MNKLLKYHADLVVIVISTIIGAIFISCALCANNNKNEFLVNLFTDLGSGLLITAITVIVVDWLRKRSLDLRFGKSERRSIRRIVQAHYSLIGNILLDSASIVTNNEKSNKILGSILNIPSSPSSGDLLAGINLILGLSIDVLSERISSERVQTTYLKYCDYILHKLELIMQRYPLTDNKIELKQATVGLIEKIETVISNIEGIEFGVRAYNENKELISNSEETQKKEALKQIKEYLCLYSKFVERFNK